MITFETNILYSKLYKQDYLQSNDGTKYHYIIQTNSQQTRWFVAVTEDRAGDIRHRKDLSNIFLTGSKALDYIQSLPRIIRQANNLEDTHEIIEDKFADEINYLILRAEKLVESLKQFKDKHCGQTKEKV